MRALTSAAPPEGKHSHRKRLCGAFIAASLSAAMLTAAGTALANEGRARSGPTATTSDLEATVTDVVSRLAAAATAHAESVGGYTLTMESVWDDGGRSDEVYDFHVDTSVRFSGKYWAPDGASWMKAYILDRKAGTFSRPRDGSDETRRAWQLLKAHPDAWIVQPVKGPVALDSDSVVPTMNRGGQAGVLLASFLLPVTRDGSSKFGYKVISGDFTSSRLISMRLLHTSGDEVTSSITVDEQGLPTTITMTGDDASEGVPASFVASWRYEQPLIQQPTGHLAVNRTLFVRAVQSFDLSQDIWMLAVTTRQFASPKTPQGLREEAAAGVAEMRNWGFRIPIKLIPIRFGVRIEARNEFTKQLFRWDIEVRPGSKPTMTEKSPRGSRRDDIPFPTGVTDAVTRSTSN